MAGNPRVIPASPGFSPGARAPKRKGRGPCIPVVGAPKTLPLALGLPSVSRPVSRDAASLYPPKPSSARGPRSHDVWSKPDECDDSESESEEWEDEARYRRPPSSGRSPGVYSQVLDLDAWAHRGDQIRELAKSLEPPSALLTAIICDTLSRLAPEPLPQHSLIQALMAHIETSIYCSSKGDQYTNTGMRVKPDMETTAAVIPPQYAGRVPFFVVQRRQEARFKDLRERMGYLMKVRNKALNLRCMAPTLCNMSWDGIRDALLVWLFGFWRMYHAEAKRASRKKAEMLALTMVGDTIQPFMHWRIFVIDQYGATVKQTRHCFMLEKRMLAVEVKDLEEQRSDVRSKLKLSKETSRRLQSRLDQEVNDRQALGKRLADARPELVRSTLCSVLNMVFDGVLRVSQLSRVAVRRSLATKEFTVLLTFEEESTAKLASVPAESLLKRWLNYNLMQCKLVATEIFESVARARAEDRDPGSSDAKLTEWSARDADLFSDRCRTVRGLQRISNLDEDLKDGAVLSVLYASLASDSHGSGTLNPTALWPLDERDLENRATKLCGALRLVLPTRAAQCLLKPSDITRGNTPVISTILATFFLHFSNLPSSVPKNRAFDYLGAGELNLFAGSDAHAPPEPDFNTNAMRILSHGSQSHDGPGADAPVAPQQSEDIPVKHVITSMERAAMVCGYDSLQQLSLLLRSGLETPADLMRLPPSDFLLRWMNYKLDRNEEDLIASLSDLKGGKELMELLRRIAPDVVALMPEARLLPEARKHLANGTGATGAALAAATPGPEADNMRMMLVVEVGARCTSFDILTKEALAEGQADVIAAFLAGLFLSRPCLPVCHHTELKGHIDHLEATIKQGSYKYWAEPGKDVGGSFAKLCRWLQDNRQRFQTALDAVQAARNLHETVELRLHTFLGDLLAQRARGTPCKIAEEPEVRDAMRTHTVSNDRLKRVIIRETDQVFGDAFIETAGCIEDLLRKHASLFHQMFQFYAVNHASQNSQVHGHHPTHLSRSGSRFSRIFVDAQGVAKGDAEGGGMQVDLHGLMRVYKDCRLRSTGLMPRDIDLIFAEIKSEARDYESQHAAKHNPTADEQQEAQHPQAEKEKGGKLLSPTAQAALGRTKSRGSVNMLAMPQDFGLRLEDFMEAMIVISARAQGKFCGSLPEKIFRLTERCLWPHACRPRDTFFYQLAFDTGVRAILIKNDAALRAVFTMYVSLGQEFEKDVSDVPQPANRMSRTSLRRKSRKTKRWALQLEKMREPGASCVSLKMMHIGAFEIMLGHADLLKGRLDDTALKNIFEGIQEDDEIDDDSDDDAVPDLLHRSSHMEFGDPHDMETLSSLDDEEEVLGANHPIYFSFPEFTDALIAIVLYHDPNPFMTFASRFERFLREKLLKPLQKHWIQNSPDAGLGKTLQELLGERDNHRQTAPSAKSRRISTHHKPNISADKFSTFSPGGGNKAQRRNREAISEAP